MQPVHPPIALSFKELSPDRTRSLISAKMIPHESISTFLYEEDGAPEKFFYENDSPNVRWKQKKQKVAKRTKRAAPHSTVEALVLELMEHG
jgi:hypothetical protein